MRYKTSLTDDQAAFAAWYWHHGISQARIGLMLGVSKTVVCLAISEFIKGHSDAARDHWGRLLDNEMPRQRLAGIVAANYCKNKGRLRVRIKAKLSPNKEF